MNILIINQHIHDQIGGSEVQSNLIAEGLLKENQKVTYLIMNGKSKNYSLEYDYLVETKKNISMNVEIY